MGHKPVRSRPATRGLLATPPEDESYRLERELTEARALTTVPVTQVFVPSTARADRKSRV
jgi:hypothetical protein